MASERTERDAGGRRVLVIGAGVIGLTTALCLRRRGFEVAVIAERFAPGITSNVAGALWEWPPGVCGKHLPPFQLERSRRWAAESLRRFNELLHDDSSGVYLRPVTFYFRHDLTHDAFQQEKMAQLAAQTRGFRRDPGLIVENGIGPRDEYRDAYQHLAPQIDTDVYLPWLLDRVNAAGCEVATRAVAAPLEEIVPELLREFRVEAIVNCTGLAARELSRDPALYPLRGALVRVRNDGRTMPPLTQAHCVSHDGVSEDPGFIFILPRGSDRLILGGIAEPNEADTDLHFDNSEQLREIVRRSLCFLPVLKDAELDAAEPIRVGLRPARDGGTRLEWDAALPVLHHYGHGGSGVTYSWGAAQEAAELLLHGRG